MPARPGAATVPFNPPVPWQLSQVAFSKILLPRAAKGLSGREAGAVAALVIGEAGAAGAPGAGALALPGARATVLALEATDSPDK